MERNDQQIRTLVAQYVKRGMTRADAMLRVLKLSPRNRNLLWGKMARACQKPKPQIALAPLAPTPLVLNPYGTPSGEGRYTPNSANYWKTSKQGKGIPKALKD